MLRTRGAPRWLLPLLLVLPGACAAAFVVLLPLAQLLRLSVHHVSRFGRYEGFAGLSNFQSLLADPVMLGATWRTLIWTVSVVGGTILVALPVALVLNQKFWGRRLAHIIILMPWAVSLTSTAIVWRRALNGETGLLNALLERFGLISNSITWLGSAELSFTIEILIAIQVSIPFCVAILLSGLSCIPPDLLEAARLDGAKPWDRFWHVSLPLLRPFMGVALVFNLAYVPNSFPIIWVLTQGGPDNQTDILVTYMYKLAFVLGRMGDAAALALLLLIVILSTSLFVVRLAVRARTDD